MPISLSVNLNKVALLRNSRTENNPSIDTFAHLAIDSGAAGLTAHPRPDLRHIRPDDLFVLAQITKKRHVELNIEGNPFAPANVNYPGLMALVRQVKPDQCTLVPDNDAQLTSDHGFDMQADCDKLAPIVQELKELGVRVSIFMDPNLPQIDIVKRINADRIELYTGPFASAYAKGPSVGKTVFEAHCEAALHAQKIGLGINAGHDLDLSNMSMYRNLPGLQEVSIGHALTADALFYGFAKAVTLYSDICS